MEENHAFGRQSCGMLHLPVRFVWSILSIKSAVGLERAVHVGHWYSEQLETERDSCVSAEVSHHGTQMSSGRGTADCDTGHVQVELFSF